MYICICCKLMEHIIKSNIMSHLENNKILYNLQHGFRKARSCETQLIDFIQELEKSNNCNKQTVKHNSLTSYKNWQKVTTVVNKL